MPNHSISMQLLKEGQTEPELVYVNAITGKWKSPGGLHLMDPANKEELAFCWGLSLDKCFTLEQGTSTYRFSGGAGNWQILGVF